MIDGLVFGLVDNGVLILGAFTGLSIEKYLPKRYQAGIGAVQGMIKIKTSGRPLAALRHRHRESG